MVQAKLAIAFSSLLIVSACQPRFSWEKFDMDGHRTGVTAPDAENIASALGVVDGEVYTSPNGKRFEGGSTTAAASVMIDAQSRMGRVREVIACSTREMRVSKPESELSNWVVDRTMEFTGKASGRKVDVGIFNFGGIRVPMPAGNVTVDDIESMFPFRNYLCYVELKGADLKKIFDWFSARNSPEAVGGVRYTIKDRKTEELLVGGEPLDTARVYGVATIDFLLDGGDSLFVAKNARDLIITPIKISEAMLPYVRSLGESGTPLEYHTDGRVKIL